MLREDYILSHACQSVHRGSLSYDALGVSLTMQSDIHPLLPQGIAMAEERGYYASCFYHDKYFN